ncbi:DUF1801 domain-containing protein [Phytomonospora sp. NPDC050363]|uniref:iron chaperone n=1 Tax=Phytomonospora sp. NPDC050363 TaxID=3155642 RepID=UPI0033F4036A
MNTQDSVATGGTFSTEERDAMKDRARELKEEARRDKSKASGDKSVRAKIAKMRETDRTIAERLHDIITDNAPDLTAKLWYGMPAYTKDGKVVCFFQSAQKFKTRYATLGFSDQAKLDDGDLWGTYFAIPRLGEAEAERIAKLVRRAVLTGAVLAGAVLAGSEANETPAG